LIFQGLFFEHNADIGQKDHFWMDTKYKSGGQAEDCQSPLIVRFSQKWLRHELSRTAKEFKMIWKVRKLQNNRVEAGNRRKISMIRVDRWLDSYC